MIHVRAYAKINLTLEVLGRRPDGYHEVRSVAQTIRLHDSLRLEQANVWQVVHEPPAEFDDDLIRRAGRALEGRLGRALPTRVRCLKRIPVGAGMGGGSSDAAAALLGLRRLWDIRLPVAEFLPLAAGLGSDVPFLLRGGTALLSGRGEVVDQLPPTPPCWVALAVPPGRLAAKTAVMYGLLEPQHYTDGQYSQRFTAALEEGRLAVDDTWNVFEQVADRAFPGLNDLRERLSQCAGAPFRLSGAGPALYALFPDRATAQDCLRRVSGEEVALALTTTVGSSPHPRTTDLRPAVG